MYVIFIKYDYTARPSFCKIILLKKRKAYKKAASDYRHEQYLKFAEKKRAATKARKISEANSKRNKKN